MIKGSQVLLVRNDWTRNRHLEWKGPASVISLATARTLLATKRSRSLLSKLSSALLMLESIADIDRLASSAICVDHFATREVIEVPHNGRVSEVRAWMEVNDFDVAPLQGQQKPMVVLRSDLADGGEERPVQALARSVGQEQLVCSSTALPSALQVLQSYGWVSPAVRKVVVRAFDHAGA